MRPEGVTVSQTKWLSRVKALLARADDQAATPAEAEACRLKAAELIAKYGIEQAVLDAARVGAAWSGAPPMRVTDRQLTLGAPYAKEKAFLVLEVARLLGGLGVITRSAGLPAGQHSGQPWVAHVFAVDVERIVTVAELLLVQLGQALTATAVPAWENPRAFRRAFTAGWRHTVISRIEQAHRRAAAESMSASGDDRLALVLADRRSLAEDRLAQVYPRRRAVQTTYRTTGFNAGRTAGDRADVGGARLPEGASTRAIGAI